jgi:hypothetical protein
VPSPPLLVERHRRHRRFASLDFLPPIRTSEPRQRFSGRHSRARGFLIELGGQFGVGIERALRISDLLADALSWHCRVNGPAHFALGAHPIITIDNALPQPHRGNVALLDLLPNMEGVGRIEPSAGRRPQPFDQRKIMPAQSGERNIHRGRDALIAPPERH